MRKKGFTLIELLVVIIILAIIALIAVPVIMNIIVKANKSAFKDSAYGIIKAGELYYSEKEMLGEPLEEKIFEFPEAPGLEISGSKPKSGSMKITEDGDIELSISDGKYCAKKGLNESEVILDENLEDCGLGSSSGKLITSLELNTESVSIINGGTYKIETTIEPNDAENKELKWTSNNESIATVSEDGTIIGLSGGETTIIVDTQDGSNIKKGIAVTVRQQVNKVNIDKTNVTVKVGESETIIYSVEPENAYLKALKWESSNSEVATVENGVITGVWPGSTTITVSTIDGSNIRKEINVTVDSDYNPAFTTDESLEITDIDPCLMNEGALTDDGTCELGTAFAIKVNNKETYKFYVINDDGNELTLIMNKNIGSTVAWISEADYKAIGKINFEAFDVNDKDSLTALKIVDDKTIEDLYVFGANDKGPLTALKTLEERTSDWTNIEAYDYILENDDDGFGGSNTYEPIERINVRARMLTYTEASNLGCVNGEDNSCPVYLYENTYDNGDDSNRGYWLSTADSSDSKYGWSVDYYGSNNSVTYTFKDSDYGVRPVIKISKSF